MILHFSDELQQLEKENNVCGVCEKVYIDWCADKLNKNKLLVAGLELWLAITWYVPFSPEYRSFNINENLSRLHRVTETAVTSFRNDHEVMALFGYCLSVQPFWFLHGVLGEHPELISQRGKSLIQQAWETFPEDLVIAAMNHQVVNKQALTQTLLSWDEGWIRDYFISVLPPISRSEP